MPSSEDIDDPAALIARVTAASRGEAAPADEMDDALAQLLAEEAEGGRSDSGPDADEAGSGGPSAEGPLRRDLREGRSDDATGGDARGDDEDGAPGDQRPV